MNENNRINLDNNLSFISYNKYTMKNTKLYGNGSFEFPPNDQTDSPF